MSENLATILTETAEQNGDKTAFKLDDVELNYSMLDEGSARVAGLLKSKGLEPGDRVGLMMPNVPYFPAIYFGILRAGGVVVPMNVLLKGREVALLPRGPGREDRVRLGRLRRGRRGRRRERRRRGDPGQAGRVREAARRAGAGHATCRTARAKTPR